MQINAHIPVLKHQSEFANSFEKFQCLVGGFGSGKSQADVFRSMQLMKIRDKALIALYAPTYRDLIDTNIPDFEEILSKYRIKYQYKVSERKIIVNQGCFTGEIWFRSADKPSGIVGYDATDSIIDEYDILPPHKQRELWIKMLGRMRGAENSTIAVSTTAEGFRETYELFEKKKIGPLIRAKTTDNTFLPDDYIETLYSQYDAQLVKQYINAEFVNVNGMQAYYGFSRDVNHLSNADFETRYAVKIDKIKTYCIGMDFNVHKMCAEVFVNMPELNRMHFINEIILKHPGHSDKPQTEVMCDIIRDMYPDKNIRIYPDASGKHRETSAINSDIAILEKAGFQVYANKANPAVRDRLNSANTMLGKGTVTIDTDLCPDITADFEKCQRDKYGDIDKSDETLTHSSDAGTYPIVYLYPVERKRSVTVKEWRL